MHASRNLLLLTDSYKVSHYKQYPPQTQKIYSYFESPGGDFPATVFFGLQYYLEEFLQGCVMSRGKFDEAESLLEMHFSERSFFNRAGWEHIADSHGGRLPLRIKAVPEESVLPTSNVFKQPVTDQGKRSKAGRLKLVSQNDKLMTVRESDAPHESDLLQEVFLNGEITRKYSWQEICDRADLAFHQG